MGAASSCLGSSDVLLEASAQSWSSGGDAFSSAPPPEPPNGYTPLGDLGAKPSLQGAAAEVQEPQHPILSSDGSPSSSAADAGPVPGSTIRGARGIDQGSELGRMPASTSAAVQCLGQGSDLGAVPSALAMEPPRFELQREEPERDAITTPGADPWAVAGRTLVSSTAPESGPMLEAPEPGEVYPCVDAEPAEAMAESRALRDSPSSGASPSRRSRSSLDVVCCCLARVGVLPQIAATGS